MLKLSELIAKDVDDYVAISVRLMQDHDFYKDIKQKISTRKERLFHDTSVADAFRHAVETVCRQPPTLGQLPIGSLSRSDDQGHAA